jgi:hypothetical protein
MLLGRPGCIAVSIRNKRVERTTRQGAYPWRVFATLRGTAIVADVPMGASRDA